ncbi:hypothetical protein SAMN05421579_1627 [Xenorhabdus japonica]|uniref:Uncharacterized protein n=1 Tax=Xenorhabdus japonica TaxID=53341 RepID=A0A1I5EBX5_9GAMM|nr:hypothetical protein SAMN05421579_1627 [Xenorhabdus japonica]
MSKRLTVNDYTTKCFRDNLYDKLRSALEISSILTDEDKKYLTVRVDYHDINPLHKLCNLPYENGTLEIIISFG